MRLAGRDCRVFLVSIPQVCFLSHVRLAGRDRRVFLRLAFYFLSHVRRQAGVACCTFGHSLLSLRLAMMLEFFSGCLRFMLEHSNLPIYSYFLICEIVINLIYKFIKIYKIY